MNEQNKQLEFNFMHPFTGWVFRRDEDGKYKLVNGPKPDENWLINIVVER